MFYAERNDRQITKLDPTAGQKVRELLGRLEAIGEDVLIASGARTEAEQEELWMQGRTKPGNIVTHVRDGDSFHTWNVAIDLVPVNMGLPAWNDHRRYEAIARIARELGFEWGFALWGFDMPHFQYTQGLSIKDFKAGKRLQSIPAPPKPFIPVTERGIALRLRSRFRGLDRMTGRAKEMLARRIERELARRG